MIIGNDLLRGVSGGQRQRVRIGEMLLSNVRLMCMDEVTTGLDSSVSLHIFAALKALCRISKMAVLAALLQPTPELYSTFDDIILLRHGTILYHGRRTDIPKWLKTVAGVKLPEGADEAGFLVAFLTDPKLAVRELQAQQKADKEKAEYEARKGGKGQAPSETPISGGGDARSSTVSESSVSSRSPRQQQQGQGQGQSGQDVPRGSPSADPSVVKFHFDADENYDSVNNDDGKAVRYGRTPEASPRHSNNGQMNGDGAAGGDEQGQTKDDVAQLAQQSPRKQVFEGEDDKRLKEEQQQQGAGGDYSKEEAHAVPRSEQAERTGLMAVDDYHQRSVLASPPIRGAIKQQWPASNGTGNGRMNRAVSFQEDKQRSADGGADRPKTLGPYRSSAPPSEPVFGTTELRERYEQSEWAQLMSVELELAPQRFQPLDPAGWSAYTRQQFCESYPHSVWRHGMYNLARQRKLVTRNKALAPPRIFQCVLIGFVLGTLFIKLGLSEYSARFGLLLYVLMFGAFSNLSEVPLADEARDVVSRQIDAGFYPASSYAVSVAIVHVPLTLLEAAVFCNFIYWIPAFDPSAGRFFFFLLVFILNSNLFSVLFRSVSYLASNPDVARQMDLPFIIVCVIFSGFLINFHDIPIWLKWLFWCTPLSWGLRSLALNEFNAPRYDGLAADGQTRLGDSYINQFGLQADSIFKWTGIAFIGGCYILGLLSNGFLLSVLPPRASVGTRLTEKDRKLAASSSSAGGVLGDNAMTAVATNGAGRRTAQEDGNSHSGRSGRDIPIDMDPAADDLSSEDDEEAGQQQTRPQNQQKQQLTNGGVEMQAVPRGPQHSSQQPGQKRMGSAKKSSGSLASFPFQRVSIAWQNIDYYVPIKGKGDKQLLRGVSGFAVPGTMTALMGSSGAGSAAHWARTCKQIASPRVCRSFATCSLVSFLS